ncbi:MAG: sulfite exporter TauE/SafE family protein [Promethearchaeati archaeon SRVP18_Atabeyarchaeia-1]
MDLLLIPLSLLLVLVAVGLCAGLITGVMGSSGVFVVVPMLTLFLGFPVHLAIGTSLFVDVVASLVTSITYYQHGRLDMSRGVWMAGAAVIGALLGSSFAASTAEVGLNWIFGVFLILNGLYILRTGMKQITDRMSSIANRRLLGGEDPSARRKKAIGVSVLLGLGIGMISGFVGAGGGIMFLLVLLLVLGYELHAAIGTSTLIMASTAASGSFGYYLHGNLDLAVALIISIGTLISSRIGAAAANKLGENTLGRIIALILVMLGAVMLLDSLPP